MVLSNPTGGATLVAPTNTTFTILNKNIGLAFLTATNTVSETNGIVHLVQRLGTTNAITVNYATTNGTAIAGVNYTAASGTLTFAAGETLKTISLPLLYDTERHRNLTSHRGGFSSHSRRSDVSPSNTLVVIQDADAGLSFTNSAISVFKNVRRRGHHRGLLQSGR